jgi:hypothetical protein
MPRAESIPLKQLSKVTGISYKTVKKAFESPQAPARSRPIEELVDYLRSHVGNVQLPPDFQERMLMLKLETAQERKKKEAEAAEKLRLWNLEKRGQLIERTEVKSQGAAVGLLLSSTLSGWVKDLPAQLVGKTELEITQSLQDRVDGLIDSLRAKLGELK